MASGRWEDEDLRLKRTVLVCRAGEQTLARIPVKIMLLTAIAACGCSGLPKPPKNKTKLIYFGFNDHSEAKDQAAKNHLADTWRHSVCPHWQATVSEQDADYKLLFGLNQTVTLLGRRGEVLYNGGVGVLYAPHGNPDGSGINICKLTGGD